MIYEKGIPNNISTALMMIRDFATYYDVPINIHLDKHYIHVIVGFGTVEQETASFYCQDLYRLYAEHDQIMDWITEKVKAIARDREMLYEKEKEHD